MAYRAPVDDILFAMTHAAGLKQGLETGLYPDLADGMAGTLLGEAARFAEDVLAPINRDGDIHGAKLANGVVTTAPGWKEAYGHWREGGWQGLVAAPEHGGMGLPHLVETACFDMWSAANMAFMLGPLLSFGAADAIATHGAQSLKDIWLGKLVAGEWTATMNLTEPQAGSDLNALRAKAERAENGTYRIFGQKIFITYGEHDLTDNIVHLVLARLPDAPAGTRGISLFLVPKFLLDASGNPGQRNDVRCAGLEHKMGIHGSPTCTMVYGDEGGAIGWLIGEENRGLACMFTMMNAARLAVGVQGVSLADRATQQALAYARDRKQGKAPGDAGAGMSSIALHPDVQRMLMTMRAKTEAARVICLMTANAIDISHRADSDAARKAGAERAGLLTPVAKAFSTDIGNEVATLGVQVHGGMGFIEETGAAQHMRDVRIAAIYEAKTHNKITLNFGSSGQLLGQIRNGAPVDVFISAARKQVDDLAAEHLSLPETARVIAGNELALIVPADSKAGSTDYKGLVDPSFKRIAVGEPKTVPAGQYAMQSFEKLGISDRIKDRLVYGGNVRQVLAYVEQSEVSAGVVYATDAKSSGDKIKVISTAPPDSHDPIVYPAVVVKASHATAEAGKFLDFLSSPDSKAIFKELGFTDVPSK